MAADVLRDFLVRLGFKVDDGSLKDFQRKVDVATSQVTALSLTVAAAATGIAIAVEKWSKGFEDLYYASQRTGASARNIKTFEYAISQVGGTADGARASVENLARFIRNSPGAEGWLRSNGVATRDAAGRMRDTVEILKDFGRQLKTQPGYRANVLAEVIGLDESTRQALGRDVDTWEREYAAKLQRFGFDSDTAAKKAQEMQQRLRSAWADIGIVTDIVMSKIAGLGSELVDWFRRLDPQLQTTIGWAVGLTSAWKLLSFAFAASPIGVIVALGGALATAYADYQQWQKTGKAELPWADWAPTLKAINDQFEKLFGWWDRISKPGLAVQALELGRTALLGGPAAARKSRVASAMTYFMGQGWTRGQAAGLAANIDRESGGDPTAVGDNGAAYGIAQWHGDRQAAFKRWAGKDIQHATLNDQLGFVQYELTRGSEQKAGAMLRAASNADAAGRAVSTYYERPLATQTEAAARGAAAVQLTNSPVINVHANGDPRDVAQAVSAAQNDVNEKLARDFKSRIQ